MKVRNRDNMQIWFGATIGALVSMMSLTVFFGNNKEVAAVVPVVVLSALLYYYYSSPAKNK